MTGGWKARSLALVCVWMSMLVASQASATAATQVCDPPPAPDIDPCPASALPEAEKIYRVVSRHPRTRAEACDVRDRTVAVFHEGRFRCVGQPAVRSPPIAAEDAIGPVIARLKVEGRAAKADGRKLKILIFAHGGKVNHYDALHDARLMAPAMRGDGFAPVFLVWDSDMYVSYYNRLCCVRDGLYSTEARAANVVSRAAGDVAASVVRTPQNLGGQALRFRDSVIRRHDPDYYLRPGEESDSWAPDPTRPRDPPALCYGLGKAACPTVIFPPYRNDDELNARAPNGWPVSDGREFGYVALWPARTTATFILPQVGANAWDNMVRQTRMAFQRGGVAARPTPATDCVTESDPKGEGGFAIFFDRLACEITGEGDKAMFRLGAGEAVAVELHYYGHSMGALVGNEVLAAQPDLPWKKVVYMGAATTLRDFRLGAAPALKQHAIPFYNLTLHPLNESRELFAGGALPQGSLLEWIDEMFEGPRSPDERMMGKWNNFRDNIRLVPEAVRRNTTVRVFAKHVDPGLECGATPDFEKQDYCHARTHGEFDDFSFWRDAYIRGPTPTS